MSFQATQQTILKDIYDIAIRANEPFYSDADRGADLASLQAIYNTHKDNLSQSVVAVVCLSIAMIGRHYIIRQKFAGNIAICLEACQDGLPDIAEEHKQKIIDVAVEVLNGMPDPAEYPDLAMAVGVESGSAGGNSFRNYGSRSVPVRDNSHRSPRSEFGSARANIHRRGTPGLGSRSAHGNNRRNPGSGSGSARRNASLGFNNVHPPRASSQASTSSGIVYTSNYESVPTVGYQDYLPSSVPIDMTTYQQESNLDNDNEDGLDEDRSQSDYGSDPEDPES